MKSMTGHGRGEAAAKGVQAVVECSSVNRKQGEVSLTAPRELSWIEPHVREEVLKKIARGKVQVNVAVSQTGESSSGLLDPKRAAGFLREARALQKTLGLQGEIRMETVLAAPGVLKSCEDAMRGMWPVIRKALHQALEDMLVMRAREGAHLQRDLRGSSVRLGSLARRVRPLASRVPGNHRKSLLKRLRAANLPLDLSDARLLNEVALFAERADITEELTRLESHLAQFAGALASGGPAGRKLEFIAQEMGREWNTIGAKAGDAAISRLVVAAKTELDRLKEQLANIE